MKILSTSVRWLAVGKTYASRPDEPKCSCPSPSRVTALPTPRTHRRDLAGLRYRNYELIRTHSLQLVGEGRAIFLPWMRSWVVIVTTTTLVATAVMPISQPFGESGEEICGPDRCPAILAVWGSD